MTVSPIDELRDEHALARCMLDVLERICRAMDRGVKFPAADVARVLTFFREFVETVHHAKENGGIYPLSISEGDDASAELVGELLADHDATRDLLHSLMLFWEPGELLEAERLGFAGLARTYAARLRQHMQREEELLFPHAEGLGASEQARIGRVFERAASGRRDAAHWRAELAQLQENWLADRG